MPDYYYTNKPESERDERTIRYDAPAGELALLTDNGVFSKGRVDFGSDLLIRTVCADAGATEPEKILDLGCGYGPVGISLGKYFPCARVYMLDVNERAMELCAMNARGAGLGERAEVIGWEELPAGVDLVATNPPVRAGKATVFMFLDRAFEALGAGGALYVVLQKKQGADSAKKHMEEIFGNVETIERSGGYHIIRARKS